jgi:structure-specific recognition protein 1
LTVVRIAGASADTVLSVGGGIASAKTFDMRVVSKSEVADHVFSAISKEEVAPISAFLTSKNVRLKNEMDDEVAALIDVDDVDMGSDDDDDDASIESEDDKRGKKGKGKGKGTDKAKVKAAAADDDDDESGEWGDFDPARFCFVWCRGGLAAVQAWRPRRIVLR